MFDNYKQQITAYLSDFLNQKQTSLGKINSFGQDVISKLKPYLFNGKMFRGSLVLLTEKHLGKSSDNGLIVASSLELIQAGILIHDDIIDEDEMRRGLKSIHAQYADFGKSLNILKSRHLGQSLGICSGDIAFFLAFEMINDLTVESPIKQQMVSVFSRELQTVGLAEMQDVVFGVSAKIPEEKDILNLYRFKTGRYSFSLALVLGALLTKQPKDLIVSLDMLGEILGMIYQIKDDELSLFGDSQITGKPVGADIARANKTLYYYYLNKQAAPAEKKLLAAIFGNKNLKISEIEYIRNLVKSLSIDLKINQKINGLNSEAQNILKDVKIPEEFRNELKLLLNICQNRKK